jgi:hypothetical protein
VAGEPPVQVVVRKKDGGELGEILWLMLFQPKYLAGGEAGEDGVANGLDSGFGAPEGGGDIGTFLGGGGVAPELRGPDNLTGLVERDEAMLLAADPDGDDVGAAGLGGLERRFDGLAGGVDPVLRTLFLDARREVRNQVVRGGSGTEDLAIAGVHNKRLGGLGSGINANKERLFHVCTTRTI